MTKPGIIIDIPGFGRCDIRIVVSDYTGTSSRGGSIRPGVRKRLRKLAKLVDLRIVTADSFGTAAKELKGIAKPHFLKTGQHDAEKAAYVSGFELAHVAAFGNGNDRLMLKAVKEGGGLAVAVDHGERWARDARSTRC